MVAAALAEIAALRARLAALEASLDEAALASAALLTPPRGGGPVPPALVVIDAAQRIVRFDERAEHLFGHAADAVLGQDVGVLLPPAATPGYAADLGALATAPALAPAAPRLVQARRADGSGMIAEVRLVPVSPESGHVAALLRPVLRGPGAPEDVQRAERALRVFAAVEAVATAEATEASLFARTCAAVVEVGSYSAAWVGVPEDDARQTVRPVAAVGIDADYLRSLDLVWGGPLPSLRAPGLALRTGRPAVLPRLGAGAVTPAEAQARGLGSAVALPVVIEGRPVAALNIAARELDAFGAHEVAVLEHVGSILARAVALLRSRDRRRETEARLAQITDDASVLAWTSRLGEPGVTPLSRAAEEYLDQLAAPVAGGPDAVFRDALARLDGGGRLTRRVRLRRADGAQRWFQTTLVSPAGSGRVDGVAIDITDLAEAEARLAASEERFRRIAENMHDVLWAMEVPSGLISYVSPSFETLWGRPWGEVPSLVPPFFLAGLHPADRAPMAAVIAGRARGEENEIAYRVLRRDGEIRHVVDRAYAIHDDQGRPIRMVGLASDVTEARLAALTHELQRENEALALANHRKDAFLATINHELRTPLNAILGLTEALGEDVYGPVLPRQRQVLALVGERGTHLLNLISDILDLVQAQTGTRPMLRAPLDVAQLCADALGAVEEEAGRRRVTLLHVVAPPPQPFAADVRAVQQILGNLVSNAVKFTPDGGEVKLEAAYLPEARALRLIVTDTGIGIAAADRDRIFEAFVQLDDGLARRFGGTGLGLALVRQLARAHGGDVRVESEPGRGSRFTVDLPVGD
jgi:PAS domain S-box-containing protein